MLAPRLVSQHGCHSSGGAVGDRSRGKGRSDPKQWVGWNVQGNHLFTIGSDAEHPDIAVQQQIKPFCRFILAEHCLLRVNPLDWA